MQHLMEEFAYNGDPFKGRSCVQPEIAAAYTEMAENVCREKNLSLLENLQQFEREQLMLRETRNYGYMSYYAKGYDFSVVDVFQRAGYDFTWQSTEEARLRDFLCDCHPTQYVLVKNFVEQTVAPVALYPDTQSIMMDPRRRVLWFLRTLPFTKTKLLTIYKNSTSKDEKVGSEPNWKKFTASQRSKITCRDIYALANYFGISFAWLMGITTGHHPVFATAEIDYICAKYTLLAPENQDVVMALIRNGGKKNA